MVISKSKYICILNCICRYYGITYEELIRLAKCKEERYLLLLILKKNNCLDIEKLKDILQVKNKKSVDNNLRMAEKTFFINSEFRKKYFEFEEEIEKI